MAKRERRELKNNKKTTCVDAVFLIVYILITFFAATSYTMSLIKDKINDKESVYIDCEE